MLTKQIKSVSYTHLDVYKRQDLERGKRVFNKYCQVFAVWIPDEKRGDEAYDYFNNVYDFFEKIEELFRAGYCDDTLTKATIKENFDKYHYLQMCIRDSSLDSRSSVIGFIDTRYILGVAEFRLIPVGDWKIDSNGK